MTLNPKKKQASGPSEESSEPAGAQKLLLHRQQAITKDAGTLLDMAKKGKAQKVKKVDDLARDDNLSLESRLTLQDVAKKFIEACFNRTSLRMLSNKTSS